MVVQTKFFSLRLSISHAKPRPSATLQRAAGVRGDRPVEGGPSDRVEPRISCTQSAAKARDFSRAASLSTGEVDSLLEQARLELSVPWRRSYPKPRRGGRRSKVRGLGRHPQWRRLLETARSACALLLVRGTILSA